MKDEIKSPLKSTGNIPRSKDNAFELNQLSMREFETFVILLTHDGEEQWILKKLIDVEFDHTSTTKGYDYINNLCRNKIKEKKDKKSQINKTTKKNADKPKIQYLSDKELKEADKEKIIVLRKSFVYKKKTTVKGVSKTKIYVKSAIRKEYEKFILPTVRNLKESLNDIIKEYIEGIKEEKKVRDKFKAYTDTIILALNDMINEAPTKSLTSQRFQKKIFDTIMRYFRSEILKYEVFSK